VLLCNAPRLPRMEEQLKKEPVGRGDRRAYLEGRPLSSFGFVYAPGHFPVLVRTEHGPGTIPGQITGTIRDFSEMGTGAALVRQQGENGAVLVTAQGTFLVRMLGDSGDQFESIEKGELRFMAEHSREQSVSTIPKGRTMFHKSSPRS
jgi:hypothetical protein